MYKPERERKKHRKGTKTQRDKEQRREKKRKYVQRERENTGDERQTSGVEARSTSPAEHAH
jgi:hypothetical protein